jgi:hypothetical protein
MEEEGLSKKEQFNRIFFELTGIHVIDALVDENGWLFIPPSSNLDRGKIQKKKQLQELAGHKWKNHIVKGGYAGWWIKPPE